MSDWLPDNPETSFEIGRIESGAGFIPRPQIENPFEASDIPAVRRIGEWLAACPPNMAPHIAAHIGVVAGLAIAVCGEADDDLFDAILGRGINPDDKVDEMKAMFLSTVRDWWFDR